jgi:hypothetical protein
MSKRELIDTGTDKRYVRRDEDGSSSKASMSRDLCRPIRVTIPRMTPSPARVIKAIASADR